MRFSLEKGWYRRSPLLQRAHLEGSGLFTVMHSGKIRENRHRLKQDFPMKSAKHYHSQAVQQGGCGVSTHGDVQNLTRQVQEQPAQASPALSIA